MSDDSVTDTIKGWSDEQLKQAFHEIGQALREKGGGAHTDGGGVTPPPNPPKPPVVGGGG